jgi:hypothetical protein
MKALWRDGRAGLRRTTGNRVTDETVRGFESHFLRQPQGFQGLYLKPFLYLIDLFDRLRRRYDDEIGRTNENYPKLNVNG